MARYLTKSRFKLARECPTKLFYTNKAEYVDQKGDDSFLLALAEGGHQVGALAQAYYPEAHSIITLDYAESLKQTKTLLQQHSVTIYEAAFSHDNLFVRVDIAIKRGKEINLIEVKSKSSDSQGVSSMLNTRGTIRSEWKPYVEDIAFQKYVVASACPELDVYSFLMTVDKDKPCPTNGLNQKFKIVTAANGRKSVVQTNSLTQEEFDQRILRLDQVDELCGIVYQDIYHSPDDSVIEFTFPELADYLADYYVRDCKIKPRLTSVCAKCEFKTDQENEHAGLLSGFRECWREMLSWTAADFDEPLIFDIGRLHYKKKETLLEQKRVKISQISQTDLSLTASGKPGLSQSERQLLQLQKVHNKDDSYWIDCDNLKNEISSWVFPLHFIDFETATAAIPFNRGIHPYEGIAFQFSHHIVYQDGRVEHKGEYINAEPGVFPNFDFIRALKKELENDEGSIFRYAAHENTYLRMICGQIAHSNPILPDRDELISFIDLITEKNVGGGKKSMKLTGPRNMIDMCELVKRYYFDPSMKGSVSIKKVLPAILKNSKHLQNKYSKPVYGAAGGIPSHNYADKTWLIIEGGKVKDPYKQLRQLFEDFPDDIERLSADDAIDQGGAAAMAYYRMQSEDMSDYERNELKRALLEYCELDTLAMVMLFEGWCDLTGIL